MQKKVKTRRSVKVCEQSGYQYKATLTITLKGQWLQELGFEIGDYVSVSCENGRLVITPDVERAAMEKAETEFMERETAILRKRFEAEKERLHVQFVAERKAQYGNYAEQGV
jgi:antitoxin component of MazEF toxin-antitoxin module